VSNDVVPPQVLSVAKPVTAGVHWYTRSGDVFELVQDPA
jgi:hypothetical protein